MGNSSIFKSYFGFTLAKNAIHGNNFECAFTLAEVLITLGIIGVVAALTMPALIQRHNKIVWVNQLKKSVNTLENGFKMAMAEDGVENLADTSLWQSAAISKCQYFDPSDSRCTNFANQFKKYFNVTYNMDGSRVYTRLNHNRQTCVRTSMFINFTDGSQIYLWLRSTPGYSSGGHHSEIATIDIDVNGVKKPDQVGRDWFQFGVTQTGQVIPYGSEAAIKLYCESTTDNSQDFSGCFSSLKSTDTWDTSSIYNCVGGYGYQCAARIMEKGWKMDY